ARAAAPARLPGGLGRWRRRAVHLPRQWGPALAHGGHLGVGSPGLGTPGVHNATNEARFPAVVARRAPGVQSATSTRSRTPVVALCTLPPGKRSSVPTHP